MVGMDEGGWGGREAEMIGKGRGVILVVAVACGWRHWLFGATGGGLVWMAGAWQRTDYTRPRNER